tara:strand:+ start:425 stop:607 length:183 start_codon:yes stop_codon:yes gene_type:complete
MPLTRTEWLTVFIFVFALSLNIVLLNDKVERKLGLCGDGVGFGGSLQTPCEEKTEEEKHE